jgi:hypothetical protein
MAFAAIRSLDAELDFVSIVDVLPKADIASMRLSQQLASRLSNLNVPHSIRPAWTQSELRRQLNVLTAEARQGRRLLLQFVGHADLDSLRLGESDAIDWVDLGPLLEGINDAQSQSLLLNMSTCYGLSAVKGAASATEPFFGVIGTRVKLDPELSVRANGILYRGLVQGTEIPLLVSEANAKLGRDLIFAKRTASWQRNPGSVL